MASPIAIFAPSDRFNDDIPIFRAERSLFGFLGKRWFVGGVFEDVGVGNANKAVGKASGVVCQSSIHLQNGENQGISRNLQSEVGLLISSALVFSKIARHGRLLGEHKHTSKSG